MLDLLLLIVFVVMAIRIVMSVLRNSTIFAEFQQSMALALLAPLFPIGPLVLLLLRGHSIPFAVTAASACYIPALVLARRQLRVFEHAGTDRVKEAMSAAYQALGTAIAGLIYIAAVVTLSYLMGRF
jgi:hypothetical protein